MTGSARAIGSPRFRGQTAAGAENTARFDVSVVDESVVDESVVDESAVDKSVVTGKSINGGPTRQSDVMWLSLKVIMAADEGFSKRWFLGRTLDGAAAPKRQQTVCRIRDAGSPTADPVIMNLRRGVKRRGAMATLTDFKRAVGRSICPIGRRKKSREISAKWRRRPHRRMTPEQDSGTVHPKQSFRIVRPGRPARRSRRSPYRGQSPGCGKI